MVCTAMGSIMLRINCSLPIAWVSIFLWFYLISYDWNHSLSGFIWFLMIGTIPLMVKWLIKKFNTLLETTSLIPY